MKIETERLILRTFEECDEKDLFAYLHTITVNCFMCMKLDTAEEARAALSERINDTSGLYFAIVLKENNTVIGKIFAEAESTDPTESVCDTYSPCWMLNPDYQRNGYAYEAARAYFDMLFGELNARRIYIYTEDYNVACQKLSEKLGMRREGLFREFVSFVDGDDGKPIYENTLQYAILKKEWRNR